MLNQLDEKKIAFRFNKAAHRYDSAAVLQRTVGNALLKRLEGIRLWPQTILDLGCGTGHFTPFLKKAYSSASIIGFDQSTGMLKRAQEKNEGVSKMYWLAGQAESLPFSDHSVELIYSNLMLHWSVDFQEALNELSRVLKPGGLLLFSIVGADTLKELRYCWSQVDDNSHVHVFPDMHDLGDALLQTAFTDPVMDVEYFTLLYSSAFFLMKDLKALGVQNLSIDRHRGLTAKKSLQTLIQSYETFRNSAEKLPATWEIIYGHAWAPLEMTDKVGVNEIKIAVDSIGGLGSASRRHPLLF
jgi:malonyl-CoA O-methyltransferase